MAESERVVKRRLRADAEQSMSSILEAAERVFGRDPTASLEAVAREAGVARTTVHRRFSSRNELRDALIDGINARLRAAMRTADATSAPPLIALYQLTVATLELKVDWRFSWELVGMNDRGIGGLDPSLVADLDALFLRARETGLLRPGTDIRWVRNSYRALVHEASVARTDAEPASYWADVVMQTLLRGLGTAAVDLDGILSRGVDPLPVVMVPPPTIT